MSILSGFFKTKRYRKTTDGYKLESNWTSGNTVELDDGNTVQNNLGAIKGITTSTSVTEEGYAADATTVAALNNSLIQVTIQKGSTYKFSKIGKKRILQLDGIIGASFLNLDFSAHKPNFISGETCYYHAESSGNYYMARVVINTDGSPGGTIITSTTSYVLMSNSSNGKLYGTIEWYVD